MSFHMGFQSRKRLACAAARVAACVLGLIGAPALAQQDGSSNRVATQTDWSVFVESNPTECWAVSQPRDTVNTRNGEPVAVNRGDILLFVFFRPGSDVGAEGQVSFTGGYPFAEGSTVEVVIGERNFTFYTENRVDSEGDNVGWAWPAPEDDARVIAAMRAGANAVVTARSSRGTTTRDTFSLLGFTAASQDANGRCAG